MKNLTFLLSLLLLTCFAVTAQDSQYSFKENYDLTTPAQIAISSSDGNIEVVGFDNNKTDVFYVVKKNNKVLNITRQELEKEITLEIVKTGNSLSIVVKYKNDLGNISWKEKMVVNFRLQVPRQTVCDLRTSDGNIAMKGLAGDQKSKTSDGNVEISDIKGSVVSSTSDGNVNVRKIAGMVDVKTSDGNVVLEDISGDAKGTSSDGNITITKVTGAIIAKTSDGDIRFKDLSGSLTATTSDGNVSGNLLSLTRELNVRTSDGNISVTIPGKLGLDLDIKGESLNVPLTNFSGHSDEKRIQGKSNGGGVAVNLNTSGNVTLSYN